MRLRFRLVPLDVLLAGMPSLNAEAKRKLAPDDFGDWGPSHAIDRFFTPKTLLVVSMLFLSSALCGEAYAQLNGSPKEGILQALWKWLPLILFGTFNPKLSASFPFITYTGALSGFALNLVVSFLVMAIATLPGVFLGIAQVTQSAFVRGISKAVTQFFRNSPWLVLLFFTILVMPSQLDIFGFRVPLPDWIKAVIGLTLPIIANVAELTRGAILSIPIGQWLSAESLGLTRAQTFRLIILPQCLKRMTPPWMNWYAILTMATSLISIVGVDDAMTLTQNALAAEGRSELLLPMYSMLLLIFFLYCYPIARFTLLLERRFAVIH